jgi:ABC-2 type transport system ATP-binding protein
MVLGLVTPDAGEVRLFGQRLRANRSALLGRLNFAAGYVNLPGVLTVEENLRVFARLYGVQDIPARVDELVGQLDLGELRRRPLRLPSSGQQTRVQLAKALVNEPELLVLDEPTASLDPDVGDRVRALLLRLARDSGRAMLITSHNMREIERMFSYVTCYGIPRRSTRTCENPRTLLCRGVRRWQRTTTTCSPSARRPSC